MFKLPVISTTKNGGVANISAIDSNTTLGFRVAFTGAQFDFIQYDWIANSRVNF
jgi:hypothetical protein